MCVCVCVCVSWKNGSLPAIQKQSYLLHLRNFTLSQAQRVPELGSGECMSMLQAFLDRRPRIMHFNGAAAAQLK